MKIHPLLVLLLGVLLPADQVFAQSSRSGMGAVPYADAGGTGVTFRTWAPNASSVGVKGTFNGWGTTALTKESSGGNWSVDIPGARAGQEYKFVVNGADKIDPRSQRVVNSVGNSIIYDQGAFDWGNDSSFSAIWHSDLVIYEMHAGSYNAEDWLPSTFDECAEKIAYLKELGISAVELMPINEFPGDRSWGYNPSEVFAIESSHGGPDALKRFVKACHENGIAVLVDVVHNHYGPTDNAMWQYDGWSQNGLGGIYFYNDWKAYTDWGASRPDYGRGEIKNFIQDQIRMFVEDYHIDGFRWDSIYNIRTCGGTWNQDGSDMLWQVNNWLEVNHPDVVRIAEDHAFDTDVQFDAQWDHDYLSDLRWLATAANDSDRNMDTLAYNLTKRFNNSGNGRVVYVESHDTCGDLNSKHRLPYDINSGDPEGYFAKKRALLANTLALISPGIPMIFEGSEMHEWWTFSNNQALRWSNTNTHAGIVRAYADLIHLRRNAYGNTAGLKNPDMINVHHVNNSGKVIGMIRWNNGGQTDDILIAVNCSATAYSGYSMAFPSSGTWYCLYNSDLQSYDSSFGNAGPNVGDTVVADGSAALQLGAYSMQIYSKTPIPVPSAVSFDPAEPDGCSTTVTITYSPNDGPLAAATNVNAYLGRNNWQNPSNIPMSAAGDDWTLAYVIPEDTYQLDVSFNDGTTWDNNHEDNWRVSVANCGDLPAEVSLSPAVPQGCIPVKISYEINGGPLTNGATPVSVHIGRNGWQNTQDLALTNETGDTWSGWYAIPDDTWELNYVFLNASTNWDNNNHANWSAVVSSCINTETPQLAITNPAPLISVSNSVTQVALQGTAALLTGHLTWTNTLNGNAGSVAYATNWSIAAVPLAEGFNLVRVSGTNSAVNPNHGSADSPLNSTYSFGQTWFDGQNGGTNFDPWSISSGATASLAVSNPACSFAADSYAWCLQASGDGFIQAIRPFAASLQPGDKVSFLFENGGVDSPGSVGVAFHNRFEQRLAETYFEGGATNFVVNDTSVRDTGIPWSDSEPRVCTFEMLSTLDYRLTINGQAFEGTFSDASEYAVAYIRFWNWNAGSGDDHKLFIGELSVTGAPLPVLTFSSEIAVTRAAAPLRTTQAFTVQDGRFLATVNSISGIDGNIWAADAVVSGAWNWAPLSSAYYSISNNTVILNLPATNRFKVLSLGRPGGI